MCYLLSDFADFKAPPSERKRNQWGRNAAIIGSAAVGGALTGASVPVTGMNAIPRRTPRWASGLVKRGIFGKDLSRSVQLADLRYLRDARNSASKTEIPKVRELLKNKAWKSPKFASPSHIYNNDDLIAAAIRGGAVGGALIGGGAAAYGLYRANRRRKN